MLRFDHVTYTYPGAEQPSLRGVDLQIREGEICLVAGLTGQGKSTLLAAACGLVPHFFGGEISGRVSVAGLDTRSHGPGEIGAHVGALFQDPESQLVMSSVRAEIELPLRSRGANPLSVARAVEEVALALGIEHLLSRRTAELSGGEKQKVALAAALAGRPRLVLLDEPTSQLDPVAGDELIGLLSRLNDEWETTILIAEHRLERCLKAADRAIAVEGGRVAWDGDPASLLEWAATHCVSLETPGARLLRLLDLKPPPRSVRAARNTLRAAGMLPAATPENRQLRSHARAGGALKRWRVPLPLRAQSSGEPMLAFRNVWHELKGGAAILRGVTLRFEAGETVALMGRNGAGKSTLLRHAAGLMKPTRGRIEAAGPVSLLLQNPTDYFLRDTVAAEASEQALSAASLLHLKDRHPRDLSGGERERLALAIVSPPARRQSVLALDEPTRGMDRASKAALAVECRSRAREGQTVIVATHDPEFAAACAERVILLADGEVIADGQSSELLAGGWYFATETARILGGLSGALLPEQGAEAVRRAGAGEIAA